jgi:ABC-type nitrate/sulfonate/bicarbonate transport system permease component
VVPPLIFIPFAVLLSGSSRTVEVVSIGIYAALAVGLYSLGELINVQPEYIALGRLLGAGQVRLLLTVRLPAILPLLIGPARVIVSLATGIGVVAEFLAVPVGLGRVMKFALSYSRVDLIMVAVLWSAMIVLAIDLLLLVAARLSFRWMESGGGPSWGKVN